MDVWPLENWRANTLRRLLRDQHLSLSTRVHRELPPYRRQHPNIQHFNSSAAQFVLFVCAMASRVTILYKNAARVGTYAPCHVAMLGEGHVTDVRAAVDTYRMHDCLRPGVSMGDTAADADAVVACMMQVHVCDAVGNPCTEAAAHVAPDILIRTDRGPWSAFHAQSVVLLPASNLKRGAQLAVHVATKERSNVMRAVLCITFTCARTRAVVARSEPLLVLSKPPAGVGQPFARVLPLAEAGADCIALDATSRCSPSKWLADIRPETHAMVPLLPASVPVSWRVVSLGSYRTAPRVDVYAAPGAVPAMATASSSAASSCPDDAVPTSTTRTAADDHVTLQDTVHEPVTGGKRRLLQHDGAPTGGKKARMEAAPALALVGGDSDREAMFEEQLFNMRQQLAEERAKREAAEAEKLGLARALRLLAKRVSSTTASATASGEV